MSPKKVLRSFIFSAISLYLTTKLIPGFIIQPGIANLLVATIALTLLNLVLRPIIKLFLLPINLITLGGFRWLTTIIILYILAWIVPEVDIVPFTLPTGLVVGKFVATIISALSITFIHRLQAWLCYN